MQWLFPGRMWLDVNCDYLLRTAGGVYITITYEGVYLVAVYKQMPERELNPRMSEPS